MDTKNKTIEEIQAEISKIADGYKLSAHPFTDEFLVIRGTVVTEETPPADWKRFQHPPSEIVNQNNRANAKNSSLFYGASNLKTVIEELSPKVNDLVYISYWWVKKPMLIVPVGYTKEVFSKLNSVTQHDYLFKNEVYHTEIAKDYRTQLFYEFFTKQDINDPEVDYRASIAIAEHYFKPIILDEKQDNSLFSNLYYDEENHLSKRLDALIFPTIKNSGNGHNFAIRPEFVDSSMQMMRIDCFRKVEAHNGELTLIRFANFPFEKHIKWFESDKYVNWSINTEKGPLLIVSHENSLHAYHSIHGMGVTAPEKLRPI